MLRCIHKGAGTANVERKVMHELQQAYNVLHFQPLSNAARKQ